MHDKRTLGEKVADIIAEFGGSWKFIFIGITVLVLWIISNPPFDPYPFILLNLVLSCVAAFQAPFIMMSQNRAEKKQDEAYRMLFKEIKQLIKFDIKTENKILDILTEKDHDKSVSDKSSVENE